MNAKLSQDATQTILEALHNTRFEWNEQVLKPNGAPEWATKVAREKVEKIDAALLALKLHLIA